MNWTTCASTGKRWDGRAIASVYETGVESFLNLDDAAKEELRALYVPADTFAETLARWRQYRVEHGAGFEMALANLLGAKLKEAFPDECRDFAAWTGMTPVRYLRSDDAALNETMTDRLLGLMLEYKPLTEHQRSRAAAGDELRRWEEADLIAARVETLKRQGDAARFSPEWIRVVFDCGPRIQWRPKVQEPVAPYRVPATPETRDLTAEEAREALERDWLFQADGQPTRKRIRREIRWATRLAKRIETAHHGVNLDSELAALDALQAEASGDGDPHPELYFRVRDVKRRVMFKNPAVDFDKVLFVDMPFPDGSEWPHETRHRLGYMAVPGARLLVLDGLSPGGRLRQLMPPAAAPRVLLATGPVF